MNWLISLCISLATVMYIFAPFVLRRRVLSAAVDFRESALQSRRDTLLRSLKELEFDHRTGKIDVDEFQTMRSGMAAEAANVLALLESSRATAGSGKAEARAKAGAKTKARARAKGDVAAKAEITADALIAQASRRQSRTASDNNVEAEAEALIAQASQHRATAAAAGATTDAGAAADIWTCSCGRAVSSHDRFCGSCGLPRSSD